MYSTREKKWTLQEVRSQYRISAGALAQAAGVEPVRIYFMELGAHVRRHCADRVLIALSSMTGIHWTYTNLGGFKLYQEHGM